MRSWSGAARPAYLRHRARYDPDLRKGLLAARAAGGAFIDTEVYSAVGRRSLPFFARCVRPQRVSSQFVAQARFRDHVRGVIVLCRHGRGARFRPAELERLLPLLPAIGLVQTAVEAVPARPAPGTPSELLARLGALTPRERQVAAYLCHGLSNKEVARLLGTSPNTIRNQTIRMFETTGASGRTQLALWMQAASLCPSQSIQTVERGRRGASDPSLAGDRGLQVLCRPRVVGPERALEVG